MSDQGPEPLVLFLSLLLYLGFELSFRSMDFLADITLKKVRMKFWIERSRLFCYSVIKVLGFLFRKLLYFITSLCSCQVFFKKLFSSSFENFRFSRCELLHIITWFLICQEVFSFSFKILVIFLSKMCFSCATHIILS